MAEPNTKTVDRPRHDIDRGLAGERMPGRDPATAPLDTAVEAGVTPPIPPDVILEARGRTTLAPDPGRRRRMGLVWGAGLVVLLLLVIALVT